MNPINLSIFFPVYNEEKNIKETILNTVNLMISMKEISNFEILIINDGSKDNTQKISDYLSSKNNKIKVINHSENKGYGAALKTGIKSCKYEYIFFSDADLQFDINDIKKMIKYINKYDVIIGYRLNRKDNLFRKINAMSWNILNRILFGLRVKDIDCAFKLFKKDSLNEIKIYSNGAMINAEILIKLQRRGFNFKEIAVNHFSRMSGKPTGGNINVIIKAFNEIIFLYMGELGRVTQKQTIKFMITGVLNTMIDFIIYITLTRFIVFFSNFLLLSKAISFISGSICSLFLNRNWTFKKTSSLNIKEFYRFYTTVLLGVVINNIIMFLSLKLFSDLKSFYIATLITFIWNFTIAKIWVFKYNHLL